MEISMNLPDSKANKYVHSFYPDMCAGLALQYTQIEDICNAATMRKKIITHSLRELHNGSEVCSKSTTEPNRRTLFERLLCTKQLKSRQQIDTEIQGKWRENEWQQCVSRSQHSYACTQQINEIALIEMKSSCSIFLISILILQLYSF